jgi:hypothetical protein
MKQMLLGTSAIRMKQKLSKVTTALPFTSCFALSQNTQAVTPAPEAMRPNRVMSVHGNRRQRSLALLCWLVFAAGLLVQFFSPHLKVSNGAFVIPPEMAAGRSAIRPDEIVGGQRRMQLVSVLLTVSGAIGLAFLYRDILIGAASRPNREPVEEPPCADSTRTQHPDAARKTLDEETNT